MLISFFITICVQLQPYRGIKSLPSYFEITFLKFCITVSDSLFSATGYTFGAPTPPPGSPYSPIPVAQLELLTKGYSNNIIIQQSTPADFPLSPKKVQITEKRCDEKCCSVQKTQKSCLCPLSPIKKIQEVS